MWDGIVKVLNMLGLTISQLQEELAEGRARMAEIEAENARLKTENELLKKRKKRG
jgi:cell division protein FtsB